MVYIYNTNLKDNKKVRSALCDIYGIGKSLSSQICDLLGFSDFYKIKNLTNFQIQQLSQIILQKMSICIISHHHQLMMFHEHTHLCLHWCYAHLSAVLEPGHNAVVPVHISHQVCIIVRCSDG